MISRQLNERLAREYTPGTSQKLIKEAFDKSRLTPGTLSAVRHTFSSNCCAVFSDITGFSTAVSSLSPEEVRTFLQSYYEKILPIIYKHGGLVDQIMGDGIISVYCRELSPSIKDVFTSGMTVAKEIVSTFYGQSDLETKCALHKEKAVVCMIGDDTYEQATIVGNLLTALYRVESVAKNNSVNMLFDIPEAKEKYKKARAKQIVTDTILTIKPDAIKTNTAKFKWILSKYEENLKGMVPPQRVLLSLKYQEK